MCILALYINKVPGGAHLYQPSNQDRRGSQKRLPAINGQGVKSMGVDAKWPADKVERRPVSGLTPYAKNARTHSDEQVAQIAASIEQWGWTIPVLVDEDGGIIAGHGRILAAEKLGIAEVPVMVAAGWSEEQKRAYVLADNKLAENAGWDSALLEQDDFRFDLSYPPFVGQV